MFKNSNIKNLILAPILAATVVLAGFALSLPPVYGQPSPGAQRIIFPLQDQLITVWPCSTDTILITSGYMQIVVQEFENDDGSRRLSVVNVNLVGVEGVGQFTNIPYTIRSASHSTSVYHNGQEASTGTGSIELFIEGGGVDGVRHVTGHYTYNPNGQLTVDFFNESGNCGSIFT